MEKIIIDFYDSKYYNAEESFLCERMDFYGSDKGPYNKGAGNYTKLYDHIFRENRFSVMNVLEIGLGTNNTDVPSNMGTDGKPGASLRGFRDYFPNANIYGADIDSRVLFNEDRIETFYVDQLNIKSLQNLKERFDFEFDLILDDGIHDICYDGLKNPASGNLKTLETFIDKVKKGGFYIIEDVAPWYPELEFYPGVKDIVLEIREGKFGNVSYVDVISIPRVKSKSHLRNTQVILIKK
jgi:hypothetical protein